MKKQPEIEAPPNPFTVEQILRLYEVGILTPEMSSREALSAAFDWFGFMGFPINEEEATEPFKLETVDFDEEPTPPSFFVQDVVVEGQALVIGGPEKTMKTSIAIDLGIALATGTPFLGRFPVATPIRTLLISKESGPDKLKNTRQRILDSLGIGEADGFLLSTQQDFKVAKNTNAKDFRKWVEDRGVGCVIIDPAYLILETSGKEASMYGMGPLLHRFREMCGNALPVVLHHTNGKLPEKTLPQLVTVHGPESPENTVFSRNLKNASMNFVVHSQDSASRVLQQSFRTSKISGKLIFRVFAISCMATL